MTTGPLPTGSRTNTSVIAVDPLFAFVEDAEPPTAQVAPARHRHNHAGRHHDEDDDRADDDEEGHSLAAPRARGHPAGASVIPTVRPPDAIGVRPAEALLHAQPGRVHAAAPDAIPVGRGVADPTAQDHHVLPTATDAPRAAIVPFAGVGGDVLIGRWGRLG